MNETGTNRMNSVMDYSLNRCLGENGRMDTFLSFDNQLNCPVVVRFIDLKVGSEEEFKKRFDGEMRRLSRRDRHHIGEFFGLEQFQGKYFAVRKYVEGQSIRELLSEGPFSYYSFLNSAVQLVSGLVVAHQTGVIHGNISSFNCIISQRGVARLVDFSLPTTKCDSESNTCPVGHPEFQSPEQLDGKKPDEYCDFYSLGIVFHEMLTGKLPFEGSSLEDLKNATVDKPFEMRAELAGEIPNEARLLIEKLLSRNPLDRGTGAEELLVTLQAMQSNQSPVTITVDEVDEKHTPRGYMMLSVLTGLLIILWLALTTVCKLPESSGF